jgi:hypothetical protein
MALHVQPVSSLITPFSGKLPGRFPRFLLDTLIHAVVKKCYGVACLLERSCLFLFQLVFYLFPYDKLAFEERTGKWQVERPQNLKSENRNRKLTFVICLLST